MAAQVDDLPMTLTQQKFIQLMKLVHDAEVIGFIHQRWHCANGRHNATVVKRFHHIQDVSLDLVNIVAIKNVNRTKTYDQFRINACIRLSIFGGVLECPA